MITLLNKFDDNYVIEKRDIYDIASAYIDENNIQSYLQDIIFTSKENVLAYYNVSTNKIVFNNIEIKNFCYKLFDKLQKMYQIDDAYFTYFINFYYLHVIYHELMHVSQKAEFERNDSEIFCYLYGLCSLLHKDNNTFYKENHEIFPTEIQANNISYLTAYNLINHTKLPARKARIMYLQYLASLTSNYKKISKKAVLSPIDLLNVKNSIVDINEINKLLYSERLSRIDRMNLGLPITSKEYDNISYEKYKNMIKVI